MRKKFDQGLKQVGARRSADCKGKGFGYVHQ